MMYLLSVREGSVRDQVLRLNLVLRNNYRTRETKGTGLLGCVLTLTLITLTVTKGAGHEGACEGGVDGEEGRCCSACRRVGRAGAKIARSQLSQVFRGEALAPGP